MTEVRRAHFFKNLITNPAGRITDGETVVWENLIENTRNRDTFGTTVLEENIVPGVGAWTLTGGAYIEGDTVILPAGSIARSPLIPTNGAVTARFKAQYNSPGVSPSPIFAGENVGGRLWNSAYFAADGVSPALNTGGHSSNGNARRAPLNSWSDQETDPFDVTLGPGVHYVRFTLSADSVYTSPEGIKFRRPMLLLAPAGMVGPFPTTPYFDGDTVPSKWTGAAGASASISASGQVNLATNPQAKSAGTTVIRPNNSYWTIQRGNVVNDHPLGITTAASSIVSNPLAGNHLVSIYDIDGLGSSPTPRYTAAWVKVNADGYEAKMSDGSVEYTPLKKNEWKFVVSPTPLTGHSGIRVRKSSGQINRHISP